MERKEKRKAVCPKCGWVYSNPHPSAKQRRAHRKHCGATAGGGGGGGAGGGEEKNFLDEVLAEEGRRKNSAIDFLVFFFSFTLCRFSAMMFWGTEFLTLAVEAAVEDLNRGVEERKVGSGEARDFDNTLEPYVFLHGSQDPGPGPEYSANKLENDKHFRDHMSPSDADASCGVNMDTATKHTEGSDFSVLSKAFMIATEGKQDFASAQSKVNSTMLVNDIDVGTYANNDSNGDMPVSPTLLAYPASESSVTDTQLQKMDEQVEFGVPLDHATVNTLVKVYNNEILTSIKEPMSIACLAQVEQTNEDGQLSQNELLYKDGSCLMENNDSEYLDATAYGDQSEYQNGKSDAWKLIENELENVNALQMPSSTSQGGIFRVKVGFCEDHGSVEPNATVISAGAVAGNELNIHVKVVPEMVPMVELDEVASDIPSTIQVHESNPPCDEFVSINVVNELNADQICKDEHVKGDRSTLVSDSEHEAGVSLAKSERSEGLGSDGLENHSCVTIAGTSGAQAITSDDQLTSSYETCTATIQLQGFENEFQSEEHSYPSHELLFDHMVSAEVSGVATSEFSQANERTKISNESQLVIDEATEVNNHYNSGELKQEIYEEENCHWTETSPQRKRDTVGPEPLSNEFIRENDLQKRKGLNASNLLDMGLGLQHNEKHFRHLENMNDDHSYQLEHQKVLQIRSAENTLGDDTNDPDMRTELKNEQMNSKNDLLEEVHHLNDHKVQTEHVENMSGPQLEPQNGFQDNSMVPSVRNDNNCSVPETGVQIHHVQTENGLAKSSSEESDSKESSGAASVESESAKIPITCNLSEMSGISGVGSGVCYQSLKEEHANMEPKHEENISGSQLEPQNGFQDNSMVPSIHNDNNCSVPETGVQIHHVQTENSLAKPSSEEPDSKQSSGVGLSIHNAQDFTLEGQVTPSISVETESVKNPITCNDSEMCGTSGVASGVCYQPLREERANMGPKQHPDSLQDADISADSIGQTENVEVLRGSVIDGTVLSIGHKTDGASILNPQTQAPKDLCASNVAKQGPFPETSVTDSEEPSFMTLVEPGRPSVSHEIQSTQNSQNESEARKKNANITAAIVRRNSQKVCVPLKVLLAEAKFEDQQVTNDEEHYKSLQDKKTHASQDGRHTMKAWSSKIASKKPVEPSLNQADLNEWTSSRLPGNKNQKRAKQKKRWWLPFTCCTPFY